MKKLAVLVLSICILVGFTGCKNGPGLWGRIERVEPSPGPSDDSGEKKAPSPEDVVCKVNGVEITYEMFDSAFRSSSYYQYIMYGLLDEESIKEVKQSIVDNLVTQELLIQKAKELGFYEALTEEEEKKITDQVDEILESQMENIIESLKSEDLSGDMTQEEVDKKDYTEAAEKELQDALKEINITKEKWLENITKQIKDSFVFNEKLIPHLTKDIVIKDEDVKAKYDALLKEQKDAFTTNIDKITDEDKEKEKTLKDEALQAAMEAYQNLIASYENSLANGTDITAVVVYNPDEVRYIKNILVKFSDTNIDNLQTLMSNVMNAEGEEAKAEAQKIYDDALAIAAKTVESKVNNILSKINAKEDFDKIMAELGEDDGMKADPYKTRGYSVTKEGTSFIQEFVDESFKLAKVGDVSKPFSTYYGTHIVKFAATVSKGDVPFENAKGDIKKLLESEKSNELLQNKIEEWEKAANIEKFEDIYLA